MMFDGESSLGGGTSEEEFAESLAHAIWKANAGFCSIRVIATYLEDLPYEDYDFEEDEYVEFITNMEKGVI